MQYTESSCWQTSVDQGRRQGVDMSTPLLPEVVPEIDANPVSFFTGEGGEGVGGRSGFELDWLIASVRPTLVLMWPS